MIHAQADIHLSGILNREQIVGHGDHWEEDQNQQGQGNQLRPQADAAARPESQP